MLVVSAPAVFLLNSGSVRVLNIYYRALFECQARGQTVAELTSRSPGFKRLPGLMPLGQDHA